MYDADRLDAPQHKLFVPEYLATVASDPYYQSVSLKLAP